MLFIYFGILALAQSINALKPSQIIKLNVRPITKALQDYE